MRRTLALAVALATFAGIGSAFAVSDGTYDPARMHCSGAANNVEAPERAEPGCHNVTVTISDVAGHEYFGIGSPQTPSTETGPIPPFLPFGIGSSLHRVDWWYDDGAHGCTRTVVDYGAPTEPETGECPWFDPQAPNYTEPVSPDPTSGLVLFFGLDDNIAGGEHDSSEFVNNGPSDGGGMRVRLDPATLAPWLEELAAANPSFLLTHPLPAGDFGLGFCADGICMSVQTQRQVAYQGQGSGSRDVSNYDGKQWDPESCSGERDGSGGTDDCDDPSTAETEDMTYWQQKEGTTYVQPGVQIYEDPDAQASPLGGWYPIPAIYVGTCGVIIGGGDMQMPPSDFTNSAGQWVIPTAC